MTNEELISALKNANSNLMNPEQLGRVVRETWVRWAKTQPDCKQDWIDPWEVLPGGVEMTSEELAKVKKRVKECNDCHGSGIIGLPGQAQTVKLPCYVCKDARALLAHAEEQQKEIAFLHNAIADLQADASPDSQHKAALKFLANAVLKQLRDLRAEKLKKGHPAASLYILARDYPLHITRPEAKAMWDDQQEKLQALGSVQACNQMIDWLLALVGLKEGEKFG